MKICHGSKRKQIGSPMQEKRKKKTYDSTTNHIDIEKFVLNPKPYSTEIRNSQLHEIASSFPASNDKGHILIIHLEKEKCMCYTKRTATLHHGMQKKHNQQSIFKKRIQVLVCISKKDSHTVKAQSTND